MTLEQKLKEVYFLTHLHEYINDIDLHQIETFVKEKISYLFLQKSPVIIQETVDSDFHSTIVNFLTHVIEIGSIKTVEVCNLNSLWSRQLSQYLHVMVWAYNITLADDLIRHGMRNIPSLPNNMINVYYNDDALLMIADRVEQHVAMANSRGTDLFSSFANYMIQEHLVF